MVMWLKIYRNMRSQTIFRELYLNHPSQTNKTHTGITAATTGIMLRRLHSTCEVRCQSDMDCIRFTHWPVHPKLIRGNTESSNSSLWHCGQLITQICCPRFKALETPCIWLPYSEDWTWLFLNVVVVVVVVNYTPTMLPKVAKKRTIRELACDTLHCIIVLAFHRIFDTISSAACRPQFFSKDSSSMRRQPQSAGYHRSHYGGYGVNEAASLA